MDQKMNCLRVNSIFLVVLSALYFLSKVNSSSDNEQGIYECTMCQMCLCDDAGGLEKCWGDLSDESRQVIVDQMNDCDIADEKFDIGMPFLSLAEMICEADKKKWRKCFKGVMDKLQNHIDEVNKDSSKGNVSAGIEQGRSCIGPNAMSCKMFGTDSC